MMNWLRVGVLLGLFASAGWAVDWKALKPAGLRQRFRQRHRSRQQVPAGSLLRRPWSAPPACRWRWSPSPRLEGEPIEDVANTIYRAWGVGQKGKNEGILLLLAIGDRRNRLEVGYGLEPILPDGFVGLRAARDAPGACASSSTARR